MRSRVRSEKARNMRSAPAGCRRCWNRGAKGAALALRLAGPALLLPGMIVIPSYLGTCKTVAYVSMVVLFATATGWTYGALFG